ncbi:hypothetical protein A2U01_0012548 [Trifolium medium]|uniref:Tf2-1-like SH3-like domain-containing protein n=1 Tax=Trifolium medium TaxID=97028 RepID=A0A392MVQ8_9FABA|nr:hypothetical protein [Trifolium medium]
MLAARQDMLQVLHRKLQKVQLVMKAIADKKRRFVEFKEGDFVYLKLRPYRQQSLTQTSYSKLSKRFYGPYKILERIGVVAYKLELPPTSKLHPVFHCSLLKLHQGPLPSTPVELPPAHVDHRPLIEPLAILDSKMDSHTSPPTRFVLVQWRGLAPEDTSWENWLELKATYHLEDKVDFPGECIDSNTNVGLAKEGLATTNTEVGLAKRVSRPPAHLKDFVPK